MIFLLPSSRTSTFHWNDFQHIPDDREGGGLRRPAWYPLWCSRWLWKDICQSKPFQYEPETGYTYCRAAPEWQTQPSWEYFSLRQIVYLIYWGLKAVPGEFKRGRQLPTSDLNCVFAACMVPRQNAPRPNVETSLSVSPRDLSRHIVLAPCSCILFPERRKVSIKPADHTEATGTGFTTHLNGCQRRASSPSQGAIPRSSMAASLGSRILSISFYKQLLHTW